MSYFELRNWVEFSSLKILQRRCTISLIILCVAKIFGYSSIDSQLLTRVIWIMISLWLIALNSQMIYTWRIWNKSLLVLANFGISRKLETCLPIIKIFRRSLIYTNIKVAGVMLIDRWSTLCLICYDFVFRV
jgi:hypothetical protein